MGEFEDWQFVLFSPLASKVSKYRCFCDTWFWMKIPFYAIFNSCWYSLDIFSLNFGKFLISYYILWIIDHFYITARVFFDAKRQMCSILHNIPHSADHSEILNSNMITKLFYLLVSYKLHHSFNETLIIIRLFLQNTLPGAPVDWWWFLTNHCRNWNSTRDPHRIWMNVSRKRIKIISNSVMLCFIRM